MLQEYWRRRGSVNQAAKLQRHIQQLSDPQQRNRRKKDKDEEHIVDDDADYPSFNLHLSQVFQEVGK